MLYVYLIWWVEKEFFGIVNRDYVPTRHSKNKIPNTILYHSQFLKVGFLIYDYLQNLSTVFAKQLLAEAFNKPSPNILQF
jgi:hypothetical protein